MKNDPDVTETLDHQVNSGRIEEVDDCLTPSDQLLLSIAVSLKRIAEALDGKRPEGSVVWWLETIASAATAGRS